MSAPRNGSRLTITRALLTATLVAAPASSYAQLRLARLIADGMVMQRDAAVPVWGWAAPRAEVVITFDGRAFAGRADSAGAWTVALPRMPAGGPHELRVAAGGEQLRVRDILVGDVWVASGQSNMEWTVADATNGAREAAAANDPKIRHFKVPTSWAERPERELAGGSWAAADSAHAGSFSAVAYFFARELRARRDVPIGIINTTWGGSRIEAWMSREALGIDARRWEEIAQRERDYQQHLLDTLRAKIGALPTTDAGLVGGRAVWADPALDDAGWATIEVPKLWEQAGYEGMDGIAWYRTAFTLTADEARRGVRLGLGMIDDSDISYVNGVEVGRTTQAWNRPRVYEVPPSALRPGRNVLAVRVEDTGGGGGIYGDPALLFLDGGGARRPLGGTWKFRVGAVSVTADGQHTNKVPTLLYNKMVYPLLPYPVKGVLWYQGESNADRYEDAVAYRPLFAGLITSWRRAWKLGDIPFLWVQLPNFMARDSEPPARSNWAALRESQHAARALPNTGEAVTIDLGEAEDIHPKNKQDVGRRLALVARRVAYGDAVEYSGPVYRAHEVRGGRVAITFDHAAGLTTKGGGAKVTGFAIAGADRHFVWADAAIENGRVVVWSDRVPHPVAVRYAWGNDPDANLYNGAGLPAAPFRTDDW
jgi:sialate O-acetylesterase